MMMDIAESKQAAGASVEATLDKSESIDMEMFPSFMKCVDQATNTIKFKESVVNCLQKVLTELHQTFGVRDDVSLQEWLKSNVESFQGVIQKVALEMQLSLTVFGTIMSIEGAYKVMSLGSVEPSSRVQKTIYLPTSVNRLHQLLTKTKYNTTDYNVLELFVQHIRKSVDTFQSQDAPGTRPALHLQYKGPFASLCQSSGMGKTRLSLECAAYDSNMHVIYICCRQKAASSQDAINRGGPLIAGCPSRTPWVADFIMDQHAYSSEFWLRFLLATLQVYRESVYICSHKNRLEWLRSEVREETNQTAFWRSVHAQYENIRQMSSEEYVAAEREFRAFVDQEERNERKPYFVFVFDEAVTLSKEEWIYKRDDANQTEAAKTTEGDTKPMGAESILNRIRKAFRLLGNARLNVFALFMDTTSSICNLFPSRAEQYLTISSRLNPDDEPKLVFPPVCMLPLPNLPRPSSLSLMSSTCTLRDGTPIAEVVDDEGVSLMLLSRAMFAMEVHEPRDSLSGEGIPRSTSAVVQRNIWFAMQKLFHDPGAYKKIASDAQDIIDDDDANLAKFAVWAVKFFLSTTSAVSKQQLVRQHMATLFGISDDGRDLIVGYRSEPMLAEAATQAMLLPGVYEKLLGVLCDVSIRGSLVLPYGKGEMGELIACMALGRAFDKASYHRAHNTVFPGPGTRPPTLERESIKVYTKPLPLVDVLLELYGRTFAAREQLNTLLQGSALSRGLVMFSHFVKLQEPLTDILQYKTLLKRGAAVLCSNGTVAKDIIIPIALPIDGEGGDSKARRPIDLWDPDSYVLTLWEVQVKSWKKPFKLEKLVKKMVDNKTEMLEKMEDRVEDSSTPPLKKGPILYMALNTVASGCSDVDMDVIGREFSFDQSVTRSKSSSQESAAVTEEQPGAKKRKLETVGGGRKLSPAKVVGLHVCGIQNFHVFEPGEKARIEQLQTAVDQMSLLRQYWTSFLEVPEKDRRRYEKALQPQYHGSQVSEDEE